MRKIQKYPRDVIHCVRSSYCIDNLLIKQLNCAGTFDACDMYSNVISLVSRDSDTDIVNVSLILRSISDGQKTCSSKGISLIGM